jgi:diguanylate cyclase (GGDEF)-like protein
LIAMKRDTTPHIAAVPGLHATFSPACIVVLVGTELGRRVELTDAEATIGRDDDNAISVAIDTISRRHARIFLRDLEYTVEDLGSTNGTFINEQELSAPTPLRNGDLLRCGGAVFKFIEGGNIEALYHEEIYRLTITDGLTQVANKRHFRDFLEREIARAVRHGRPLSLVLFDLDHFKSINDRYGHLAGDRVLQGISSMVSAQVRRDELLARYGGEEFAVVLPETNLEEAAAFCERIRQQIEHATFDFDGKPLRATVSLGVATLAASESMASLIARTDAHLYAAKQAGRNRTAGA